MTRAKTKMEWQAERHRQDEAGKQADELIGRLGLTNPIDPLHVARTEYPLLRAGGTNLGSRYDGKLEYYPCKKVFLLFYNTNYDERLPEGEHHPRTRFSIAHELGHFFLEHHHQGLRHGGKPHRSVSEFRSSRQIEREADAFAANLLLPTVIVKPIVNRGELSVARLDDISEQFKTSIVSTAIRSVRLSHFPCAVAGIRDGEVAWMFPSEPLIEAGIYPRKGLFPNSAKIQWQEFLSGECDFPSVDGRSGEWFTIYDDEFEDIYVTEEYVSVSVMGTLLVLVTLDESDLFQTEEDHDED